VGDVAAATLELARVAATTVLAAGTTTGSTRSSGARSGSWDQFCLLRALIDACSSDTSAACNTDTQHHHHHHHHHHHQLYLQTYTENITHTPTPTPTHTHTRPFNSPFSFWYRPTRVVPDQRPLNGRCCTRVSRYQKGKTNLDFTAARDSEWQWHQLGHMQVCISLQTDNHASTSPLSFLQAGCPSCRPTNSVKVLKASIQKTSQK